MGGMPTPDLTVWVGTRKRRLRIYFLQSQNWASMGSIYNGAIVDFSELVSSSS